MMRRAWISRASLLLLIAFVGCPILSNARDAEGASDKDCPTLKFSAFKSFKGYASDPSVALMQAVLREDETALQNAIKSGADVNQPQDRRDFECWIASKPVTAWQAPQWTYPLFQAAQEQLNPSITADLLHAGARPDVHPYDLDPVYADRRELVTRMPWSFYGRTKGARAGSTDRNWSAVMAEFVKHGFVMSGEYLARKPAGQARDVAYRMLTSEERAHFDTAITASASAAKDAETSEKERRQRADARVAGEIAIMNANASARAKADNESLPDAVGAAVCKQGTLRAAVCLQGTPLCQNWSNAGTLYGYVEGASPDRQRLQIRVSGALLPPGVQSAALFYRGTTFDGLAYTQGQIIWGQKRDWARCNVTSTESSPP